MDLNRRGCSPGFTLIELLITITVIAILASIAVPKYRLAVQTARRTKVQQDLRTISFEIDLYESIHAELPATLPPTRIDPWGNPYRYTNFSLLKTGKNGGKGKGGSGGVGQMRKNRFLVPINTDYDLWSMGPDGKSQMPLTAKASRDDIIRADDGRYIGLASEY